MSFPPDWGSCDYVQTGSEKITGRAECSDTSLSEKTHITGLAEEGGGCFRDDEADEIILRETTEPATRPTTSRYV